MEIFATQAAGKYEVEEHSTGLMPKSDPTGKSGLKKTHFAVQALFSDPFMWFSTDNMTGMVGTALYVSPEVQGNTKATYNQVKVLIGPEITPDF